jgi:hypothetical protein
MREYWGLIEAMMTLGGVSLFVWWQMHTLKRDIAAREKREAEAAAKAALNPGATPASASGTAASS